mmetsp:Transcript_13061/g.19560  ORF Transcript_13061/g.19560 Transcript_13061/m.19560 type:complete len:96 (-) Transcript_13061:92-379(-)
MCDAVAVEGLVRVEKIISPDIVRMINVIGVMGVLSPKMYKSLVRYGRTMVSSSAARAVLTTRALRNIRTWAIDFIVEIVKIECEQKVRLKVFNLI